MPSEKSFWALKSEVQEELTSHREEDKCSQWIRCQKILLAKGIDVNYPRVKSLFNLLYDNKIEPASSEYVEDLIEENITYEEFIELNSEEHREEENED